MNGVAFISGTFDHIKCPKQHSLTGLRTVRAMSSNQHETQSLPKSQQTPTAFCEYYPTIAVNAQTEKKLPHQSCILPISSGELSILMYGSYDTRNN